MTAVRDVIVPGSVRTKVIHWECLVVTLMCGRCGSEFEARAECKTARCKQCNRVCRLDKAPEMGPNVISLRKRAGMGSYPDRAAHAT